MGIDDLLEGGSPPFRIVKAWGIFLPEYNDHEKLMEKTMHKASKDHLLGIVSKIAGLPETLMSGHTKKRKWNCVWCSRNSEFGV